MIWVWRRSDEYFRPHILYIWRQHLSSAFGIYYGFLVGGEDEKCQHERVEIH